MRDEKASSYTVFGLKAEAEGIAPGLHVVATPIGNLRDMSLRALSTLAAAHAVLAEDTRVSHRGGQRLARGGWLLRRAAHEAGGHGIVEGRDNQDGGVGGGDEAESLEASARG